MGPRPLAANTGRMDTAPLQILILKTDRLYADMLRQHAVHAFAHSRPTIATSIAEARELLGRVAFDLFITGLGEQAGGDALDLVAQCKREPLRARRVVVLLDRHEYRVLAALRTLPVDGIFDPAEDSPAAFGAALPAIVRGSRYWSPGAAARLRQLAAAPGALFRILTDFEQVVLSVIGDGSDDLAAAEQLGLSPATISTVRRALHRKLGVQHRGELVRIAAQKGYVRFTPVGVERPGYGLLAAAYQPRQRARRPECATMPATA